MSIDEHLGVPVFIALRPLSGAAEQGVPLKSSFSVAGAARQQFKTLAGLYGVSHEEVDAAPLQFVSPLSSGAKLVRFSTRVEGLPVFREQATVLLDRDARMLGVSGFIGGTQQISVDAKSVRTEPLSPKSAAAVALADFEFSADVAARFVDVPSVPPSAASDEYQFISLPRDVRGAREAQLIAPIRYRSVWYRLPQGLVSGIYLEMNLIEDGAHHAYSYVIGRDKGQILFRNSLAAHDVASTMHFGVWADPESLVPYPNPHGLMGHPFPENGAGGTALPVQPAAHIEVPWSPSPRGDPWIDSDLHPRLRFTRGNNVEAWADRTGFDGYDGAPLEAVGFCPSGVSKANGDLYACSGNGRFVYDYDFAQSATHNVAQISSSVTNLFYVTNWLHEWFYAAGFDEAAGNAQRNNFGRGGIEGDPISARALVYSAQNNASMVTPSDGERPVLRTYVYSWGSPTRSAALDNTIVIHEWGHFLTNRLVGNANGLAFPQAKALGEGWGDFIALLVTVTERDKLVPGNAHFEGAYAHAAYANSANSISRLDGENAVYFGSRRYPYSTDLKKNPLTFGHIQDGNAIPDSVPVHPRLAGTANSQVHNMGQVWGSMLWECYASMLQIRPFTEARERMRDYLVGSLKMTPVNPTFIEARDALLTVIAAKDAQDYAGCLSGFAKRGAGLDAVAPPRTSLNNAGVVESFRAGPVLEIADLQLSMNHVQSRSCDGDSILDNGETAALMVQLVNRGNTAIERATLGVWPDHPAVEVMQGPERELALSLLPGQSTTIAVPVYLNGFAGYGRVNLGVSVDSPQLESAFARSVSAWVNADVHLQSARNDAVEYWPSGMGIEGRTWSVSGDESGHWYQSDVPKERGQSVLYTPQLHVRADEDLIITFDQQFDFGTDATNGGQLVLAEEGRADVSLPLDGVRGTGKIWSRNNRGVINSNPLRGETAFIGKTEGWSRDVRINLGRAYAGHTVRIGWRVGTSENAEPLPGHGWQIDNIRLQGVENQPFARIETSASTCMTLLDKSNGIGSAGADAALDIPLQVQLADVSGRPQTRAGVPVTLVMESLAEVTGLEAEMRAAQTPIAQVFTDADGAAHFVLAAAHSAVPGRLVSATLANGSGVALLRTAADKGIASSQETTMADVTHRGAERGGTIDPATASLEKPLAAMVSAPPQQPRAIPSLTNWGLIWLSVFLASLGAGVVRRRDSRGA